MHDTQQQERTTSLAGKTVLVTGGARRVGAEIVRHLHACGANVLIHCHRSGAEADELSAALEAERRGSSLVHSADLLDTDRLPELVAAAVTRFGSLDVLVNSASTFYPTPFGSITPAQWADLMGTNLKAPLFLAQAAAAQLRRSRGLLINIADIHGLRPLRDYSVYSAAKAGLIQLTRALARELAPEVRVNGIAPGPVMWPEAAAQLDAAHQQEIIERTLLKRAGSAADVARTVRFFAVDAPYITGQILAVDGGRSVGW
jgi:pteridine reductase